jgi:ABC-type multidrug transport system fused ATPase/permease subunit
LPLLLLGLSAARRADRILHLEKGQLVEQASVA